jgi:hypothetical protein
MSVASPDRCLDDRDTRICCECGRSIEGQPTTARFCGRSCQLAALNARRGRSATKGYSWRPCSACGRCMLLNRNRPCGLTPNCTGYHKVGACREQAA